MKKVIIDSDLGLGADDAGALAVAHYFDWKGDIELLATMSSTAFDYSISAINVINLYYGNQVTLGAFKGTFGLDGSNQNSYAQYLVENFPNGGIITKD